MVLKGTCKLVTGKELINTIVFVPSVTVTLLLSTRFPTDYIVFVFNWTSMYFQNA